MGCHTPVVGRQSNRYWGRLAQNGIGVFDPSGGHIWSPDAQMQIKALALHSTWHINTHNLLMGHLHHCNDQMQLYMKTTELTTL